VIIRIGGGTTLLIRRNRNLVSGVPNSEALEESGCDDSGGENGVATIMIHESMIHKDKEGNFYLYH
jgi:hypothetical protein